MRFVTLDLLVYWDPGKSSPTGCAVAPWRALVQVEERRPGRRRGFHPAEGDCRTAQPRIGCRCSRTSLEKAPVYAFW